MNRVIRSRTLRQTVDRGTTSHGPRRAIAAVVLLATASVGCGGSANPSQSISGSPSSDEPKSLDDLSEEELEAWANAGDPDVPEPAPENQGTTDPTSTEDSVEETTTTVAARVDASALTADIEAAIDAFLAESGVPGATLAVLMSDLDGSQLHLETARGLSDVAADRSATPADFYRWGSITKTMTSVIVLQLVEEGLIELDAPVATYLGSGWASGYVWNGVDYGDLITIRQILNHTDGFPEYAFDPGFYIQSSLRLETPYEPEEIVDWAISVGPKYEPGTAYEYNTVGHVVAGLVIEAVTGQTADAVMQKRIFDPADAGDAVLTPASFPPNDDVAGYVQGDLKLAIDLLPGYAPYKEASVVGDFYDITVAPEAVVRSAGWTGGGLEAQADDVARIFRSEFTGALSKEMLTEFTTTSEFSNYGLGISVGEHSGHLTYSHGGGVPGFRSDAVYLPEFDITVVVSTNLIPYQPDVGSLSGAVLDIILSALNG